VTAITLSYTFYPVAPKPGIAETPAGATSPAAPATVPRGDRAG